MNEWKVDSPQDMYYTG